MYTSPTGPGSKVKYTQLNSDGQTSFQKQWQQWQKLRDDGYVDDIKHSAKAYTHAALKTINRLNPGISKANAIGLLMTHFNKVINEVMQGAVDPTVSKTVFREMLRTMDTSFSFSSQAHNVQLVLNGAKVLSALEHYKKEEKDIIIPEIKEIIEDTIKGLDSKALDSLQDKLYRDAILSESVRKEVQTFIDAKRKG